MARRSATDSQDGWGLPDAAKIKAKAKDASPTKTKGRVKLPDLLWACEQLTVTEQAGVPLFKALAMLAKMRKGTPIGARMDELQRAIGEGSTFAEALETQSRVWSPTVVALISAGEASGGLAEAFTAAGDMLEARQRLRRKLRTAMTYPTVVMVVTAMLVTTLLLVVVPRFAEIYDSFGGELPGITQFVMKASSGAPLVILVLGLIGGAIAMVLSKARTDPELALKVEDIRYRMPLVGKLMVLGVNARVSATLASLLDAGVPLLEALDYAGQAAASETHRRSLKAVKNAISDGSSFGAALAADGLWPETLIQLVEVGEETGRLTGTMVLYSKRARDEVEAATESLTTLIEPLMMVVIGAVVGVFLLALYLPLIDIGTQIS